MVTICGFSYLLNKILKREEPSVSMSSQYNNQGFLLINTSETLIAFCAIDALGIPLDYSYYSPVAQSWTYYKLFNGTVYKDSYDKTNLKVAECSERHRLKGSKYENLYDKIDLTGHYCFEPNQTLNIQSPFGSFTNYTYINLYITYCSGNENCANSTVIEKMMTSYYFRFVSVGYFLNNNNFEEPFQPFLDIWSDMSSSAFFKRSYYYLKNIIYNSDNGIVLNDNTEEHKTVYDSDKTIMDFRDSKIQNAKILYQFTITFNSQGIEDTIKRTYKKIQNIMAEIGGFVNALRLISMVLLELNYLIQFYPYILNKYYLVSKESNTSNYNKTIQISTNKDITNHQNLINIKPVIIKSKTIEHRGIDSITRYEVPDPNEIFHNIFCFRQRPSYNLAKDKLIRYYLDILNLVNMRNEINAIKFLTIKESNQIAFMQKTSKFINIKEEVKIDEELSKVIKNGDNSINPINPLNLAVENDVSRMFETYLGYSINENNT
jgi:hypothetical protein